MMNRATKCLITAAAAVAAAPLVLTASPAGAVVDAPLVPVTMAGPGAGVPGHYIVTLRNGTSIDRQASRNGVTTRQRFGKVLNGFSARLSAAQLARLRSDPDVAAIEQDRVVRAQATQADPPSWGLDRIDQVNLPLSRSYTYGTTAPGVHAYVIDTGIATSHPDFGGRAAIAYDGLGGDGQDCNGHGTHMAGTIGGSAHGVAKAVRLRAVRVLDCNGSGTTSNVIAGMDWVANNHAKPAVANMSLGGGRSSAVDNAADGLAAAGVFVAVAAGGGNTNACDQSPAGAANVTTVAASGATDAKAPSSSYGPCVELYAPGVGITSTWLNGGTRTISGTSTATAHVTGVAALYKATYGDASFATIRGWLAANASAGVISGNPSGTPNLLLNKRSL